jgi:Fuc2NAc and GlcNAc transferase
MMSHAMASALALSAGAVSAILVGVLRRYALETDLLDRPNSRSSHVVPTPRGGGLAIVVTMWLVLAVTGTVWDARWPVLLALGLGGTAVAVVGLVDDRRGLGVLPRILVHTAAALTTVCVLWLQFRDLPQAADPLGWTVVIVLVLGVVWNINLLNFMDGIDGIAASQAVFVTLASALLIWSKDPSVSEWTVLLTASAAACAGFLVWNWPPAKIFLGDVGSGFLGFWIAALAISLSLAGVLAVWTSIILSALFVADASVTLLRRLLRGDRWYEAHRSHAYQVLARRWGRHLNVTALAWLLNLVIVLPLAYVSVVHPQAAPWIAFGSVLAVALACASVGAGAAHD